MQWCVSALRRDSEKTVIRIRPGRVALSARRLRGSQPCGCTSPDLAGHSFPFPRPAQAGHMAGVAQRKSSVCKTVCRGSESRPGLHMDPSGHGFSLFPVRLGARSSAGPPRQCRTAEKTSYLHTPHNCKTPRKDGAAAGGIPLPEDGRILAVEPNAATCAVCRAVAMAAA